MEIFFSGIDIQKICEQRRIMERKLGAASARKLWSRLSDLQAALNLSEIHIGKPHPLKGDRAGQFAISLHGACRLVFESVDEPVPLSKDGSIAWHEVVKINIVFIGDYHD